MNSLTYDDVKTAAERIHGRVRPVLVSPGDPVAVDRAPLHGHHGDPAQVWLAHEHMQHTGSFKARGAINFLQSHIESGTLPPAGVTIASGGNAGLACAWAAAELGITATVFLPRTAPPVKVGKLRGYGADVRLAGSEYADALAACEQHAAATGALASHAYAHPLISAGAGTLLDEISSQVPGLDTIVVAVGGGGLFAGVATAAQQHGIRTVAVEPENCRALNASLEAGRLVDVPVDSIAADSLGARRTWQTALDIARGDRVRSVLVRDADIIAARQSLWDRRRIVVEHGTAAALAALEGPAQHHSGGVDSAQQGPDGAVRGYRPAPGERVAVLLCGANTDPGDLVTSGRAADGSE